MRVVAVGGESRARIRTAARTCARPGTVRRTVLIALVVGTILTLINQLDVFLDGAAGWFTGVKVVLNFVVPFVVSNAGVVAGASVARA